MTRLLKASLRLPLKVTLPSKTFREVTFENWQDVDTAFNFLETYSTKAEEEPEEAAGDGSYSSYLAEQASTGIPR